MSRKPVGEKLHFHVGIKTHFDVDIYKFCRRGRFQLQYKEKVCTGLLEKIICANFRIEEFFIDKAIGWILREYSKVNLSWVKDFIPKYEDKLAKWKRH